MPTTSLNQGIPYPLKGDSPGFLAEYIRDAVLALEKKSVMVFASASDRDTRLVGVNAPASGMLCVLLDTLVFYKHNGTAWTQLLPTITVSTGTPTGGNNGDIWLKI